MLTFIHQEALQKVAQIRREAENAIKAENDAFMATQLIQQEKQHQHEMQAATKQHQLDAAKVRLSHKLKKQAALYGFLQRLLLQVPFTQSANDAIDECQKILPRKKLLFTQLKDGVSCQTEDGKLRCDNTAEKRIGLMRQQLEPYLKAFLLS